VILTRRFDPQPSTFSTGVVEESVDNSWTL
jgi:hypothetical protein